MAEPPADRSSGSGEREVKGLFAVGKPPPPAGAALAGTPAADPIASLFATDTIVKAPGIHDAPSEAELGRWRATMQSSLFEERVVDPSPPLAAPRPVPEPPVEAPRAAPVRATPPRLPVAPPAARVVPPEAAPAEPERPFVREPEPPSEPPELPVAPRRETKTKGKRRRGVAAAEQAAAEAEPAPARRRRFERGPSRAMLAALGICAASAVAALVIVLGPGGASMESSVAPPPAPAAPSPPAAPAAASAPAATGLEPSAAAPAQAAATPPRAPAAAAATKQAGPPKAAAPAPVEAPKAEKPSEPESGAAEDDEKGAPEGLLRASRQALSADDAPGAERIARQALAQAPSDHHAMELLVLALMDQDRGAEALPFARRMVQRRSRRVPYRLLLGDLLLMVGDQAGARAEWQKALALSPGDRSIKRRLGQ